MASTDAPRPVSPADVDDRVFRLSAVSARALEKAHTYQRQGRASIFNDRAAAGARSFEAQVRGSGFRPYQLTVRITRDDDGDVSIFGTCSCPMQSNCKHVAAAVLQWRREAKNDGGSDIEQSAPLEPRLSGEIASWVAELGRDLERDEEGSANVRKRLYYVLHVRRDGQVGVDLVSRDLDSEGNAKGAAKPYDANNALQANPAKFLRASDLAIVPRLTRSGYNGGMSAARFRLAGREGTTLLADILETGRAHWGDASGVRLRPATPATGIGAWRVGSDGAQTFGFDVAERPEAVAIALQPPHYVDPRSGDVGLLETGLPNRVACRLLAAPPVSAAEAAAAAAALAPLLPPGSAPLPKVLAEMIERRPKPVPVARLTVKETPSWRFEWDRRSRREPGMERVPALVLAFDYAGVSFAPNDRRLEASHFDGRKVRRVHRNPALETAYLNRLFGLGFCPLTTDWGYGRQEEKPSTLWLGAVAGPEKHIAFLLDAKPRLEAEGWRIEVDPDFPVQLAVPDGEPLQLHVGEAHASGIDWFDLSLGVTIDGERLDLLPAFAQVLAGLPPGREHEAIARLAHGEGTSERLLLALEDGRILPLALSRIIPIVEALLAIWAPAELAAGVQVHSAQASLIADLEGRLAGKVELMGGARLKALAEEITAFHTRPPAAPPSWFAATLRPYQQTGVDWLQMLSRAGFGGVLADDMGLGKTIQLLAHLAIEKAADRLDRPALVVAPTSVLANWHAEAERFAPGLAVRIHHGADRAKVKIDADGVDLVVTSYPLLARDRELLLRQAWSVAVLDEAQTIRNPLAAVSLAACALDARQRIALSGTPVENHLGDVWLLMHFLNPGLLGDAKTFRALYRTPIEKRDDASAKARLSRRLQPFLLRRTKAAVAADLPPKTEIRETVALNAAQQQLYEATRLVMQKKVREALTARGLGKSAIIVLDALLKLRQVCCDPRLVKTATEKAKAGGSAKLDRLVELVTELKAEGRSVLVFSQFTSMLDLIRAEFEARGWRHAWLTGDTQDRKSPVAAFQSGEVDSFLISLKAGGVGLNLTRADTVILYDPWWNPAVEAQAIDRAHRIGQSQPVFVHRLIAEGTIEEKMLALQTRKQGFADALWEGNAGGFSGLSDSDVLALFA